MIIIHTSKSGKQNTDSVVRAFEDSESLEEVRRAVEQAEDRLYATWASVEAKDSEGELIPVDDLIEQNAILMERGAPISDDHTNRIVGKTLAWKVLEHPETGTYGILHLNQIFDHNELDDQIWKEIKSGERGGSSVGGVSQGTTLNHSMDGPVHRIEGFNWMETASTASPVNPYATNEAFSVVAKSQSQNTGLRSIVRRGFKKEETNTNDHPTEEETMKPEDTTKRRVHLKPGEEPPAGAQVQTGPRGGRYYETGGGSGEEQAPTPAEATPQPESQAPPVEVSMEDEPPAPPELHEELRELKEYWHGPVGEDDPGMSNGDIQGIVMALGMRYDIDEDAILDWIRDSGPMRDELPETGGYGEEPVQPEPEGRPAEAQPETGDVYDNYDTLAELYEAPMKDAIQHVNFDSRVVAAGDYVDQLEYDHGLTREEAEGVMQAAHEYHTTPSSSLPDGGMRRRLEMFHSPMTSNDKTDTKDLKQAVEQGDRKTMLKEAQTLQSTAYDTELRDFATDVATDNLRDEEAIKELALGGVDWNYEVLNRKRKNMGLEPIEASGNV